MKTTGRKIEKNGRTFEMTSEAWWLSVAVKMENGKIEIARVEAIDGEGVNYMLRLSDTDLVSFDIQPGMINDFTPCANPAQKVITQSQHDKGLFLLETEGFGNGNQVNDNTPWMKGDNIDN
jgi:hypothetical protein